MSAVSGERGGCSMERYRRAVSTQHEEAGGRPEPNEIDRLAALHRHDILDTPTDRKFDRIVALVQNICRVPIALVSLVDEDRQWLSLIHI